MTNTNTNKHKGFVNERLQMFANKNHDKNQQRLLIIKNMETIKPKDVVGLLFCQLASFANCFATVVLLFVLCLAKDASCFVVLNVTNAKMRKMPIIDAKV